MIFWVDAQLPPAFVFTKVFPQALKILRAGEPIVEISKLPE